MSLHFDNTLGASYLGVVGSSILFGIANLQAYIYYHRHPRDWLLYRISVAVLWCMDTAHLALTIHAVYHYLITSFGNPLALLDLTWSFKLSVTINVIIIIMVQSLYALRVWKLGSYHHQRVIAYVVGGVVVCGYGVAIILAVETYKINTFPAINTVSWAIYSSFSASAGVDFVITVAMCYYLRKSRSGFSKTNSKIATLVQYTLGSGLATSACSLSALITYIALPNTLIFLGIEFLLTKLYINSFLAMLNARQSIREKNEEGVSLSLSALSVRVGTHVTSHHHSDVDNKNAIPLSPRETPAASGIATASDSTVNDTKAPYWGEAV